MQVIYQVIDETRQNILIRLFDIVRPLLMRRPSKYDFIRFDG